MSERIAKLGDAIGVSLFVVLVVLKVWFIDSLSWWWVFSPIIVLYTVAISWYYISMYKLKYRLKGKNLVSKWKG